MAALPPAAVAALGAAINAAFAAAPFATQAQLANAVAPLATQAQLAAVQAQIAALPTLAQAAIQAALVLHNAPAIAAAAAATVRAIVAARAQNAHDRSGVAYATVPRADGTPPPNWPAGFDRAALRGPIAAVDALLNDYGLPHGAPATPLERRNVLAMHIGTACF